MISLLRRYAKIVWLIIACRSDTESMIKMAEVIELENPKKTLE